MISIGFAGTAKNTGKTTAALTVLDQAQRAGLFLGLTSIGYDGEALDHITGLPKPSYAAPAGTLVTTAQDLLESGTAVLHQIAPLASTTLFGPVILAEVVRSGSLVLVGPNHKAGLKDALERLKASGVDLTLVDGALNRLAPMAACDGLVLSTGAAYDPRIPVVVDHAGAMARILNLPILFRQNGNPGNQIAVTYPNGTTRSMPGEGLLTETAARELTVKISTPIGSLEIPGACAPDAVLQLIEGAISHLARAQLIFSSALNLTASKDARIWLKVFNRAQSLGIKIFVRESLPLRCVTVNPLYPEFTNRSGQYQYARIDAEKLLEDVRDRLSEIPVVNVMDKPQPDLLNWLEIPGKE